MGGPSPPPPPPSDGGDTEPLLPGTTEGGKHDRDDNGGGYGSFPAKDGYSLSPSGLAAIVAGGQVGALSAFGGGGGGVESLAEAIGCDDVSSGLPSSSSSDGAALTVLRRQRERYGSNSLPLPPKPSLLQLMLAALSDPTMIMLLGSAAVSLVLGLAVERDFDKGWIEGTSIAVTVLLVVTVSAGTDYGKAAEFRAQQVKLEGAKKVQVVRDGGTSTTVHPGEVVVGDVVRLAVGDVVPADGVLAQGSDDLKMDESALTGETDLIPKGVFVADADGEGKGNGKGYKDPFIISGTSVMQGAGRMLVLAVGPNSVQGKILARIREEQDSDDSDSDGDGDHDDFNGGGGGTEYEKTPSSSRHGRKSGCCSAVREFFTFRAFGGGGDGVKGGGATLMEKLDVLAIDIGKIGIIVAVTMFFILLLEWTVAEFVRGGPCPDLIDSEACLSSHKCRWTPSAAVDGEGASSTPPGTCARRFVPADTSQILDYFITSITILVVAVPEGLPLAVTLALAVSMKRMMRDANQVKHLDSCETMGSATTICSDKTGTLTENRMTVTACRYLGGTYERVVGGGGEGEGDGEGGTLGGRMVRSFVDEGGDDAAAADAAAAEAKSRLLRECILLNVSPTSAVRVDADTGTATYEGNPTDCALIKLASQLSSAPSSSSDDSDGDVDALRGPYGSQAPMLDWGVHSIPFSSERKRMSWIVEVPREEDSPSTTCLAYPGKYRLYSKGAPQQMLDACSEYATGMTISSSEGGKREVASDDLTESTIRDIAAAVSEWQGRGLRTLALAYRDFDDAPPEGWAEATPRLEEGMTLLAVAGIEDPLRSTVPASIRRCRSAGVDVRMCTGDALATAVSIARGCGILRERDLVVADGGGGGGESKPELRPKPGFAMTGAEFDDLVHRTDPTKPKVVRRVYDPSVNDGVQRPADPFLLDRGGNKVLDQEAFDAVWPTLRVLARCQPEDKLALVRGMRRSKVFLDGARCASLRREHGVRIFPDHQVVAVTGDGTNDAPALRAANVGFAMGVAGTETAKQACDIILLDDDFSSIVKAVMWGRNIYDSISKFIQFQLTVNVVAITLAVVGALYFTESPLSAVQMLWVNMIMDSLASLALATELPTKELLDRMPYGRQRPVISTVMKANILGQSLYQISVLSWVLFSPATIPYLDPPVAFEPTQGSHHWSLFFNVFVMLQLFNEFNSRRLPTARKLRASPSEWNVLKGLCANHMFVSVMAVTFVLQALIVTYGGAAVNVAPGGLSPDRWAFSVAVGLGGTAWQMVVYLAVVLLSLLPGARDADGDGTEGGRTVEAKKIASGRKLAEEEVESYVWVEGTASRWDAVRLGVRRGTLYSTLFNTSFRTGVKIARVIHTRRGGLASKSKSSGRVWSSSSRRRQEQLSQTV